MTGLDPRLQLVERFFAGTGLTYDRVVHAATFGIDDRWKRRIVDRLPPDPRRILDLACGTGILTLALARRYPRGHVVGVDLRDEYLEIARGKVRRLGIRNVELIQSRAEDYRAEERFDGIVSSYLAKYADLTILTENAAAMLEPGGVILMHDFTFPPNPVLVAVWRGYFWMLQRLAAPWLPRWREIFFGLPRLIEQTRWVPELMEGLRVNGFQAVELEYLTAYGSAIVTARKPARSTAAGEDRVPAG
ncbi:methyltransferase domain-containing protein [Candidatus Nitrospira bockiana]